MRKIRKILPPFHVADHRAELCVLYPGGLIGRSSPLHQHADDPQDLCLSLDRVHGICGYAKTRQDEAEKVSMKLPDALHADSL